MKPDKLDIKIQEAAEQQESLPGAYPEAAWNAMEKLLDKEMPQKKKRRWMPWLFSFLVLGAGIFLITYQPWKTGEEKNIQSKNITSGKKTAAQELSNKEELNKNKRDITASPAKKMETKDREVPGTLPGTGTPIVFHKNNTNSKSPRKISSQPSRKSLTILDNVAKNKKENPVADASKHSSGEEEAVNKAEDKNVSLPAADVAKAREEKPFTVKQKDSAVVSNTDTASKQNRTTIAKKKKDVKGKNKFENSFAFTVSAGGGASGVNLTSMGSINPVFGAGVSYQLSRRFTLHGGFYVEQKVYAARPAQYHPPSRFWTYYPYLTSIDAACKIFEIPVAVDYSFALKNKHAWFASAGLSSYLMKKENYTLYSKTPSGDWEKGEYDIKNKNNHFFSSLKLAMGYERKINNAVSVMARPYVNIPLQGIGYGKVDLYSAGILFSVRVKPFAKK